MGKLADEIQNSESLWLIEKVINSKSFVGGSYEPAVIELKPGRKVKISGMNEKSGKLVTQGGGTTSYHIPYVWIAQNQVEISFDGKNVAVKQNVEPVEIGVGHIYGNTYLTSGICGATYVGGKRLRKDDTRELSLGKMISLVDPPSKRYPNMGLHYVLQKESPTKG